MYSRSLHHLNSPPSLPIYSSLKKEYISLAFAVKLNASITALSFFQEKRCLQILSKLVISSSTILHIFSAYFFITFKTSPTFSSVEVGA